MILRLRVAELRAPLGTEWGQLASDPLKPVSPLIARADRGQVTR